MKKIVSTNKKAFASIEMTLVLSIVLLLLLSILSINAILFKNIEKNSKRLDDFIDSNNTFVVVDILFQNTVRTTLDELMKSNEEISSDEVIFYDYDFLSKFRDNIHSDTILEDKLDIRINTVLTLTEIFNEATGNYEENKSAYIRLSELDKIAFSVLVEIEKENRVIRCQRMYYIKTNDIKNFNTETDIVLGELKYERIKEK